MYSLSEDARQTSDGNVPVIGQRDVEQIYHWNSSHPVKIEGCIHTLIHQTAQQRSSEVAVCSLEGDFTYQELEDLSQRLAVHLRHLGIRQRSIVPFCFEKSRWAIIAMMAILKAGGAFVAIDPAHPHERIRSIIDDVHADLVICTPSFASLFQSKVSKVVSLAANVYQQFSEDLELQDPDVSPQEAACVLYTSGSTGRPKGIVLSHSALSTMAKTHADALHVEAKSRVFQYAAYTFDVSVMDVFTALYRGGCVCIPSEAERKNNIAGAMNRLRVDWADLTPTVASLLTPQELPGLKTLVLAGEEVTQELVARWSESVRMINCYGPAESAACTAFEYPSRHSRGECIGRAMAGARCWIVDPNDHNRLVSIGAIGELVVEGNTLADGYLNNPMASRAVFVCRPTWYRFSMSAQFYKTGDLAYYDSDGSIIFVGRKDSQVKIRGQRVELSEIEHCVSANSQVAKTIVSYPRVGPLAKKLVAMVQLEYEQSPLRSDEICLKHMEPSGIESNTLAKYVASALPSYMVPDIWLFVETLPLSPSAKLDRKRISLWLESADKQCLTQTLHMGSKSLPYIPSDDKLAIDIGARVAEVVARGDAAAIGVLKDRNFRPAEIGLDSIQVMTLSNLLHREFGVKIGVEKLTRSGLTIQNLADEIRENDSSSTETIIPRVDLLRELNFFREELIRWKLNTNVMRRSTVSSMTVFLTGATGFLGTNILKLLLQCPDVTKVVLLVRARSEEKAFDRVIGSAKTTRWWHDCYFPKIECWTGDLGLAKLGLTDLQWARLSGHDSQKIDVIIHNGAAVRWNVDYESLEAENVTSTKELLQAVAQCSQPAHFIYISGGQKSLTVGEDDDMGNLLQASASSGYSQTKLVSEIVVKEFARNERGKSHQTSIIKPGYIIGTPEDGLADTDDYIWRFVAGALDIQGFDDTEAKSWLFVADVDRVASVVLDSIFAPHSPSPRVIKILDGMTMERFWQTIGNCGYSVSPLKRPEWLTAMRKNVGTKGEGHPLWPLLYMFEDGNECLSSGQEMLIGPFSAHEKRIEAAVRRNIEYLRESGFLPKARSVDDLKRRSKLPRADTFAVITAAWAIERDGDLSKLVGSIIRALFPLACGPPILLIMYFW